MYLEVNYVFRLNISGDIIICAMKKPRGKYDGLGLWHYENLDSLTYYLLYGLGLPPQNDFWFCVNVSKRFLSIIYVKT